MHRAPTWVVTEETKRKNEWVEQEREQEKKRRNPVREGEKLQYGHSVFRFTLTSHSVPVRSSLDVRLSPYGNVSSKSGERSEMLLGSRFETWLAAWQMSKRALHYKTRTLKGAER